MELIISIAIGLAAGVLSGMFGVGGSTITTPFMRLFLNALGKIPVGTPLPIVIPTAISGAIVHYKEGMVRLKEGLACGLIGSFPGVIGAWLTKFFSGPQMMIMTSIFIILVAARFAYEGRGSKENEYQEKIDKKNEKITWPRIILIGFIVGLASGFLGVGGGPVLIPAFVIILGINMHEAVATSLLSISIIAIPGSIAHYLLGNVDISLLIPIAIAAIIGAQIGARCSTKTQERRLRIGFTIFLLAIAIWLGVSEFFQLQFLF